MRSSFINTVLIANLFGVFALTGWASDSAQKTSKTPVSGEDVYAQREDNRGVVAVSEGDVQKGQIAPMEEQVEAKPKKAEAKPVIDDAVPRGVVFVKEAKYGQPVYLVSVFEAAIVRTKMISEHLYANLYERFKEIQDQKGKVNSKADCTHPFKVTVKKHDQEPQDAAFCVGAMKSEEKQTLNDWFLSLSNLL